jgi:general L-amino acid transport system permease protein
VTAPGAIVKAEPAGPIAELAARMRERYFRNQLDTAVSVALLVLLCFALIKLVRWGISDSVWDARNGAECVQRGSGACWAVIHARFRVILFGVYPYAEQWRPVVASVVLIAACLLSSLPSFWKVRRLAVLWVLSLVGFIGLMQGGVLGLPLVAEQYWGGLALTVFVFAAMMILGMPLAVLLALARHYGPRRMRLAAGTCIDLVRAVPLITILFTAWLFFSLLFPEWLTGGKLFRAVLGFSLFFACYEAEVLRGGLQAIGRGQEEAAAALGLRFWQRQRAVILQQAWRLCLPQTMNLVVGAFKDTSYISILGFFDLVATASAAIGSGEWAADYVEVYIVVAALYFVFTYSLSRYGIYLERRVGAAQR